MSLIDKLNTAKGIDNGTIQPKTVNKSDMPTYSEAELGHLDEMVFGSTVNESVGGYDPKKEMELMSQPLPDNLDNCRLPAAIKESIMRNPLTITSTDPQLDAFAAKVAQKVGGSSGIEASASIINRLEEQDRQKTFNKKKTVAEQKTAETGVIDYGLIKMIVEGAINEKLGEIKGVLNESVGNASSPSLRAMKMADKFLFLDSEDNIWECQMTYKGKNKKKK